MTETCPRCHQEIPGTQPTEYDVFYIGSSNHDSPYGFAGQKRTVKAYSHFDAVCKGASSSEHSSGDMFMAIGVDPDRDPDRSSHIYGDDSVARLFTLTKLDLGDNYDFIATTSFRGRYSVAEVNASRLEVAA